MAQHVTAQHLTHLACLYVRQSTLQQVLENTESTARQYALRERARALGWPDERIVVIDQDLGHSGASMVDRLGFQRLVAEVGLGQVGLVLGLEVSRLARNSRDWHHLLEICGGGSCEKDSPFEIVAMEKEQKASLVHDFRLGKGQRHAHKTGEALAQRIIPALHMSGFPCFFAYSRVLLLRNHISIYFQEVCKAMALAILLRNRLPQPLTGLFTPPPNRIRHHLTRLTA
jgi:hypothetical protein